MSFAKNENDLPSDKTFVNPAANTKRKSTQVQNPNGSNISAHGNTSDGNGAGSKPRKTAKIRSNPQENHPMSVNGGKGPGKQGN